MHERALFEYEISAGPLGSPAVEAGVAEGSLVAM